MSKRFIFMRHGESQSNKQNRVSGSLDSSLTELGKQQAYNSKEYFKDKDITIKYIYTSPLQRALDTATILRDAIDPSKTIPIIKDVRLSERSKGQLENLPRDVSHAMKNTPGFNIEEHGGESLQTFTNRVSQILEEIINKHASNQVIIVSHSNIYTAMTTLLNTNREPIENCDAYSFKSLPENVNHWIMELIGRQVEPTSELYSIIHDMINEAPACIGSESLIHQGPL